MNCTINSAGSFSGLQAGISQISPAQLAATVRKSTLDRPFICPILQFLCSRNRTLHTFAAIRLPNMGGRIGIDVDEVIRKFGVVYDVAQRVECRAESLAWSDTDCYLDVVCLLYSCPVFAESTVKDRGTKFCMSEHQNGHEGF